MARITVEDCIKVVPNRFDLVILAARRSREISGGASISVLRDRDKDPIVALREIAGRNVDDETLKEQIIQSMQRVGFIDEREGDLDEDMDHALPKIQLKELDVEETEIDGDKELDADETELDADEDERSGEELLGDEDDETSHTVDEESFDSDEEED